MNPKKKRPFILFEILIGLSLLSVLLSILFSFFTSSAKLQLRLERAENDLLMRQHLQTRLQSILTSIIPPKSLEGQVSLYTLQADKDLDPSLIVTFDNGIDPDPAFSGAILGRIFLKENQLCLAMWPSEKKKGEIPTVRREVLMEGVTSFTFRFLARNIDETIEWKREWPKEKKGGIPSLILLELWDEIDKNPEAPNLKLSFILPSQEPAIIYKGKKKQI